MVQWFSQAGMGVWAEVGIIIHAGIARAGRGCERPLSEEDRLAARAHVTRRPDDSTAWPKLKKRTILRHYRRCIPAQAGFHMRNTGS